MITLRQLETSVSIHPFPMSATCLVSECSRCSVVVCSMYVGIANLIGGGYLCDYLRIVILSVQNTVYSEFFSEEAIF